MLVLAAVLVLAALTLCVLVVKKVADRLGIDIPATLVWLGLAEWPPVAEPRPPRTPRGPAPRRPRIAWRLPATFPRIAALDARR